MGQKFELRDPDTLETWMVPPEDWQFREPLVSVGADGEVVSSKLQKPTRVKGQTPKMRPISEVLDSLNKEVDTVKFFDLPMEKQIKLVAEEYSAGTKIHKIEDKLGISKQTIYDRLDKARAMGLVTMRGAGNQAKEPKPKAAENVKTEEKPDTSITPDFFKQQAEHRRAKAERLSQQAERLEQAGVIANALTDLLGDSAQDLVNGLYVRVS